MTRQQFPRIEWKKNKMDRYRLLLVKKGNDSNDTNISRSKINCAISNLSNYLLLSA